MEKACTTRDNVYLDGSNIELRMLKSHQATPPVGQHYQSHIYFTTPHRVRGTTRSTLPLSLNITRKPQITFCSYVPVGSA